MKSTALIGFVSFQFMVDIDAIYKEISTTLKLKSTRIIVKHKRIYLGLGCILYHSLENNICLRIMVMVDNPRTVY